jgi:Meiotically up-regulated gene 113
MLTVEDLRNPARVSGFNHVYGPRKDRAYATYAARAGFSKDKNHPDWRGPRRATPEEAAQDYCDYMNGQATPATPALKSAGHKRTVINVVNQASPELQKLREELRELERAERVQRGSQGYIYLIGETFGRAFFDATLDKGELVADTAVKIGYSDAPDARIAMLQTGNPRKLVLLGTIEGTLDDERALHAKYIKDNVLQEWFRPTQELLSEFGVTTSVMGNGCLWVDKEREAA